MAEKYSFTGEEGERIDLTEATKLVTNWRRQNPGPEVIRAHFFGKKNVEDVLAQPSCVGIRIYYALDDSGKKQLVVVGADKDGNNIIPQGQTNLVTTDEGIILDVSMPCPSFCPTSGGFGE